MQHPSPTTVIDTISAGAVIGSLLNCLPPIAAFVAILWYTIQIYESKTFQAFLDKYVRKTPPVS